jgi:hypothetical protein
MRTRATRTSQDGLIPIADVESQSDFVARERNKVRPLRRGAHPIPCLINKCERAMKKLFILMSSVALLAGCHSRDTGGTYYDENRSISGTETTPPTSSTQPSDSTTSKGAGGAALTSTNNPANQPSNP